jgi:hypothetical protein
VPREELPSGSAIRFSRRPTPTTVGCNTERTNGGWAQSASHTGKREGLNTTEFLTHTHAPAIVYTHVPKCHKTPRNKKEDPPTVLIFPKRIGDEKQKRKNRKSKVSFYFYFWSRQMFLLEGGGGYGKKKKER